MALYWREDAEGNPLRLVRSNNLRELNRELRIRYGAGVAICRRSEGSRTGGYWIEGSAPELLGGQNPRLSWTFRVLYSGDVEFILSEVRAVLGVGIAGPRSSPSPI